MALACIVGVVLLLIGVSLAVLIKYNGVVKWVWAVWKNRQNGKELSPMIPRHSLEETARDRESFSEYLPPAEAGTSTAIVIAEEN